MWSLASLGKNLAIMKLCVIFFPVSCAKTTMENGTRDLETIRDLTTLVDKCHAFKLLSRNPDNYVRIE
jgi:hypothetical protein